MKCILACLLLCAGCGVEQAARVDTLRITDTLIRVDTIFVSTPGVAPTRPTPARPAPARAATAPASARGPKITDADLASLRARELLIPVAGVSTSQLRGTFSERRGTNRVHEALDIIAPRGTAVLSADAGRVLKLFESAGGGLTVYTTDESGRFIYYYAHLDSYAPGLAEGQRLAKGNRLGAVGTTGNAPVSTPHLHFAILRSDNLKRWWNGTPLDPLPIFRGR